MRHFISIILGLTVSLEAFAIENKESILIQKGSDLSSYTWLYKHSVGSNFSQVKSLESSKLSGALVDLSGEIFGLTGRYSKHEIIAMSGKTGLGVYTYNSRTSGYISSVGVGNSETLFDSVIMKSSLAMKQQGLGISIYLPGQQKEKKLPQTNFFAFYSEGSLTHNTRIIAGAINSNLSNQKYFNNFSLGYQQRIDLFEGNFFNPSLDFSRSFSVFGNSYETDQVDIGLSLKFNPYSSQSIKNAKLPDYSKEKKIRLFLGHGSMFASGRDQQSSDSYNVNTEYAATLSPETEIFDVQLLVNQYKDFIFGPEFGYKILKLNHKMKDTTFLGNSYRSRNQTDVTQNSVGYRGQYLLSETDYLTFGTSVGFGQYSTKTHTENASSSSTKVKKGDLILINCSLGVGRIYKISKKMNLVLESSLTYMNGKPFGVDFESHEFNSKIGFEIPFYF